MKCDVCIIGAGPAGLNAASELLRHGASIILIDKHHSPGGKTCGGGLTHGAVQMLSSLLSKDAVALLGGEGTKAACRQLTVYSTGRVDGFDNILSADGCVAGMSGPGGTHSVKLKNTQPYMVVSNRKHWQGHWLQQLQRCGVKILTGHRVIGIDGNQAILANDIKVHANWFIAADGPRSSIRRQLKIPSSVGAICRQLTIDRQYAMHVYQTAPSVWFNYRLFDASYGWVFPFEAQLRIGCGVPASQGASGKLKLAWTDWLSQLRVPVESGRNEAGSIGCRYAGHRFGRILLAGDAAGMASSVTGEGIYQALVSGREVAKEISIAGYRSEEMLSLAIRHERTVNGILAPVPGRLLYSNTASLLRIPGLAKLALRKFS